MKILLRWIRHRLLHDGETLNNGHAYEKLPEAVQMQPVPKYAHRWQLPGNEAGKRPQILNASSDLDRAGYKPVTLEVDYD